MKGLIVAKYNGRRSIILQLKHSKPSRIRKRFAKRMIKNRLKNERSKI